MFEIVGVEGAVPIRRPAPRPVVEALRVDGDIVAGEHAVDEAGGDVGSGQFRGRFGDLAEQPSCRVRTLDIATPDLIRGDPSSFTSVRGLVCIFAALIALTSIRFTHVILLYALVQIGRALRRKRVCK